MTNQPPLVQVTSLSKRFADVVAVDDLSFSVFPGDIYGFLGQNGAGKSTTIRMLLTLITPSSGTISVMGYRLPEHRNEVLRQVGAVIERPDLYKYLSAYDNLSIFARLSGLRPSRSFLMDRLAQVGLANRAGSLVKTYSQGMKQRLGIAIALVHDPQLVILDEPTNGLDPQGIADMRRMILDLRNVYGKTVIVSSHLLNEIEQVATRMIIIHRGSKVIEGSTHELFDPSDTVVELSTSDQHARQKMLGTAWAGHLQDGDGTLCFRLHADDVPRLARDLVALDIPIGQLSRRHSLENLFLQLTTRPDTPANAG